MINCQYLNMKQHYIAVYTFFNKFDLKKFSIWHNLANISNKFCLTDPGLSVAIKTQCRSRQIILKLLFSIFRPITLSNHVIQSWY